MSPTLNYILDRELNWKFKNNKNIWEIITQRRDNEGDSKFFIVFRPMVLWWKYLVSLEKEEEGQNDPNKWFWFFWFPSKFPNDFIFTS